MPTITIEVTNAQAQRIAAAFGPRVHPLDPTTPATLAEVRGALVQVLRDTVEQHEREQAVRSISTTPLGDVI